MKFTDQQLEYLKLLSKRYSSIQKASTEIINLKAILSLPKGTEHYLSDLHGEYEAFIHILHSGSGVIRRRIYELFKNSMQKDEQNSLATLIYYPKDKIRMVLKIKPNIDEWYEITLYRLIKVCCSVSSKYTRSKVRKALPADFAYVIEELLHESENEPNKQSYYDGIIKTIISTKRAQEFIIVLCILIRKLTIDRLHIVGDIFDRGPKPDIILKILMKQKEVDVQWGNHDIVWMGAALGSMPLIATLIRISARYNNLSTVEDAYGINLLPLATFAMNVYRGDPCNSFELKLADASVYNHDELYMVKQMQKAIAVIQFKIEGKLVQNRPDFKMENRLLLEHINLEQGIIRIGHKKYELNDTNFPTIDPSDPYRLTEQEQNLMIRIQNSFLKSEKLQRHIKFLVDKGSMYLTYNSKLMYHGCVPMTPDGKFKRLKIEGVYYSGKGLLDKFDELVRQCFYQRLSNNGKNKLLDYFYYLWQGPCSPLFGKSKMTTFERYFINDKETHAEEKNPYFNLRDSEDLCDRILNEFDLDPDNSHLINGHIPVKMKKGENPVKGNGKMIVIDGGMAKAYQSETGIAGYTLINNSYGLLLAVHKPFESKKVAVKKDKDIISELRILKTVKNRKSVKETDNGVKLIKEVESLEQLLIAYREGLIKEEK
jgi:fructose-1,6-bisphosphatase III